MSRKESMSRRQVAGEGSPEHSHPEAVWKGWIDTATTKGEALIDRLARPSWVAGRLRGLRILPPLKNKKAIQIESSREMVHSTQPVGVVGKWKLEGGKGRPLWKASRAWPTMEKHLGFCVLAQQKQTLSWQVPPPVIGEKRKQRKFYTVSLTSVCL